MPKVFISHAWDDNEISRKLYEYLTRQSVDVWIDYKRMEAGDKLPKKIGEALKWCDTLLLIWSHAAEKSYWVEEEWTNALSLRKIIIPLVLDNVELPPILSNRLFINFKNFDQGYNELCRRLKLETIEEKKKKEKAAAEKQKLEQERLEVERKEKEKQREFKAEQERQKKKQERLQLQEAEKKEKEKQLKLQAEQERKKRDQERLRLQEAERKEKEKKRRFQAEHKRQKKEQERLQKLQKDKQRKEWLEKLKGKLITKKTVYSFLSVITILFIMYFITTFNSSSNLQNKKGSSVSNIVQTDTLLNSTEKDQPSATIENTPDTFKTQIAKQKPRLPILRSEPAPLSSEQVKAMLKERGFYDESWNATDEGFNNQFETIIINGGTVVIDHASGLMWQQGGSANDLTYDKAKEYIQELNSTQFAGFDDWDLPTLEEAMSLMESKTMNGDLYIDPKFDAKQKWIWTADPITGAAGRQWGAYFSIGECHLDTLNSYTYVRAVRFGQSSEKKPEKFSQSIQTLNQDTIKKKTIFRSKSTVLSYKEIKAMLKKNDFFDLTDNKSGRGFDNQFETKTTNGGAVVVDHASGLMWQQGGSADFIDFEKANKYIQGLNRNKFAGFNNWRLPTLEEAMSLMEPKKMNGTLYIDPKFDAAQWWIWTADYYRQDYPGEELWVVPFHGAGCSTCKINEISYVRAVRSGRSSP